MRNLSIAQRLGLIVLIAAAAATAQVPARALANEHDTSPVGPATAVLANEHDTSPVVQP